MKKFILILLTLLFFSNVFAAETKQTSYPTLNADNTIYKLKFSNCTPNNTDTCINAYYKGDEYDWQWTELITIQSFEQQKSVLQFAKKLRNAAKYSDKLIYNKQEDMALVSFMIPNLDPKNNTVYVEQNIFRIEKSPNKKGLIAFEYAYRHPADTKEERDNLIKAMNEVLIKYFINFSHIKTPPLITESVLTW